MAAQPRIGVLALQGAFAAHLDVLQRLGAIARDVRLPSDLGECDALIMPGGESTTMSKLLETSGLFESIAERLADGMPTFGTCAGMILLAREVLDGRRDQRSFGALDITVRRNAYGRQVDSFETDLSLRGSTDTLHAVFIRAPQITRCGRDVEILAEHDGSPVLVRSNAVMAAAFHPELTNDDRVHRLFLDMVAGKSVAETARHSAVAARQG